MARHITFVKKIKVDGSLCAKCQQVNQQLEQAGFLSKIDRIVIADERDSETEGMRLAAKHAVTYAPFFIVREENGEERIYTVYLKFLKEVLKQQVAEEEENQAISRDLDFL
jgi:hypothetical protein